MPYVESTGYCSSTCSSAKYEVLVANGFNYNQCVDVCPNVYTIDNVTGYEECFNSCAEAGIYIY